MNSPHVALRNPGLRAYADHMATEEFVRALDRLAETGRGQRTAILCAERLPWQCHRFLISDYLDAIGEKVVHLIDGETVRDHHRSALARWREGILVYDGGAQRAPAL